MRQILSLIVVALAVVSLPLRAAEAPNRKPTALPAPTSAAEKGWLTDHARALQKAKNENKSLLINFTGSDWCPYCILLEKEVFATPRFQAYAEKNLVLLQVDFPRTMPLPEDVQKKHDDLALKYEVEGYPTVIVLSPKGKRLGMLGYMEGGPKVWIAELEKVTKKP